MKVLKFIICFTLIALTFSCESDDEVEQDQLIGVWSLKSIVSGGLDIQANGCALDDTMTFNANSTGSNYFPENDPGDPCDFETIEFSWSRDTNQLTIDTIGEGVFLIEIISLTDTQLQFSILENDGIAVNVAELRIFKYEK